ncbi:MAG: hypothetical protein QNJ97_01575 [Myxococcota bacterium]|nr:hypothetical protein [Myxococcota bacterium]
MTRILPVLMTAFVSLLICSCGAHHSGSNSSVGGGTPASEKPLSTDEMRILALADTLKDGAEKSSGQLKVTAGSAYHAASGRVCRPLDIAVENEPSRFQRRLTCLDDKAKWRFVPLVQEIAPKEPPQ